MSSFDLTGKKIRNTYQRLIQISGSNLVNGTGSLITDVIVTGSFKGDGSGLTNIPPSGINGYQDRIESGTSRAFISEEAEVGFQVLNADATFNEDSFFKKNVTIDENLTAPRFEGGLGDGGIQVLNSSALLFTRGFKGQTSASLGLGPAGFVIYSGSATTQLGADTLQGTGFKFVGTDNSSSISFTDQNGGDLEIRTDKFTLQNNGDITASNALFSGTAIARNFIQKSVILSGSDINGSPFDSYLLEGDSGYTLYLDGTLTGGEIVNNVEFALPFSGLSLADIVVKDEGSLINDKVTISIRNRNDSIGSISFEIRLPNDSQFNQVLSPNNIYTFEVSFDNEGQKTITPIVATDLSIPVTASSDGYRINGDIYATNFYGTASYAEYAVSASHEIIKEVSSSFADTASYVNPLNQDVYPSIDNTYTLGEIQYREWSSVATRMVTGNNNRMVLQLSGDIVVLRDHNTIGDGVQIKNQGSVVAQFGDAAGSGNVGIGTTSPSHTLDVSGSGRFDGDVQITGSLDVLGSSTSTIAVGTKEFQFKDGGGLDAILSTNYNNFRIKGNNNNGLYINLAGHVSATSYLAVGDTYPNSSTPPARLTVKGSGTTSSTTALRVENANASASLVVTDDGNIDIPGSIQLPTNETSINNGGDGIYFGNRSDNLGVRSGANNQVNISAGGGAYSFVTTGFVSNKSIRSNNGQVDLPSYTFSNNTKVGMYLRNTEDLQFSTSGSNRMTILDSGNVGIGTTSPTQKLEIDDGNLLVNPTGSSSSWSGLLLGFGKNLPTKAGLFGASDGRVVNSDGNLYISSRNVNAGNGSYILLGQRDSTTSSQKGTLILQTGTYNVNGQTGDMFLNYGSGDRVTLKGSTGNVGIGIGSPSSKLQVRGSGTTSTTTAFRVENANASASLVVTDDSLIQVANPPYTTSTAADFEGILLSNTAEIRSNSNDPSRVAGFRLFNPNTSTGQLELYRAGVVTTQLTSGDQTLNNYSFVTYGNFGLGTSTPDKGKLVISSHQIRTVAESILYVTGSTSNSYDLARFVSDDTARVVITNSGSVGVGTTTPETQLDITGNLTIGDRIYTRADGNRNTFIDTGTDRWTFYVANPILDLSLTQGAIFNEGGISTMDFRVESDTNTHMLFVDAGNNRVGIGQATPDAKLHIQGSGTTSSTTALKVENANASASLVITDDGKVDIGPQTSLGFVPFTINSSNGRTTMRSSGSPTLTLQDVNNSNKGTIELGNGTISNVSSITAASTLVISSTNVRIGGDMAARVNMVGQNSSSQKVLGLKQGSGGSSILLSGQNSSGVEVIGITADGGFYVRDSNLVKRYVFDHDYAPSVVDGLTTGFDFRTENASGALTTFGYIDVTNDDRTLQESSMRFSVGQTTPTEVMRLQNDGNVGIGTTSPNAKLDVQGDAVYLGTGGSGTNRALFIARSTNNTFEFNNNAGDRGVRILTNNGSVGGSLGSKIYGAAGGITLEGALGQENLSLTTDGKVGIGNTSPDASAILDIASTSKGVVFPRMTSAQRTSISSPTTGLIVYQTDSTEGLYIYKSTGWVQII